MLPGLQTHIEAWVDPAVLRAVYAKGFRLARIAAMECSADVMLNNIRDARAAGLQVLVTLADAERIRLLNPADVLAVECRNEDDGDLKAMLRGDALRPSQYRAILDEFCRVGREVGIPIAGPTCSNTNDRCLRWARNVKGDGWPVGMGYLSWHSYDPHENTRIAEMEALADGLPIIISEFGYPNLGETTEDQQAEALRALWPQYAHYYAACLFQIADGPDPSEREHRYGIRREDGTWKPAADTVPQEIQMIQATFSLRRAERLKHPEKPHYFTSPHPDKDGTVLSVQPNGSIEKRPAGTYGPWESWREDGNRAVFDEVSGYTFALPLVD